MSSFTIDSSIAFTVDPSFRDRELFDRSSFNRASTQKSPVWKRIQFPVDPGLSGRLAGIAAAGRSRT